MPLSRLQPQPASSAHVQHRNAAWRCVRRSTRLAADARPAGSSTATEELSVDIPTAEARSCIRFRVVPTGPAQQAIVVDAIADGSSAAQAGVRRGMRLTAISDPVRRDEVWQLQDRPSMRYINDALRMRSSPSIELRFTSGERLLDALDAADSALRLSSSSPSQAASPDNAEASSSSSSSSSSRSSSRSSDSNSLAASLASMSVSEDEGRGGTMADRLQQQFEQKQQANPGVAAYNQRQQRRKDYMEQVGQRKDNTFVLLLGASFLLPALVILAVAWGSGYLDTLYSNTMTSLR